MSFTGGAFNNAKKKFIASAIKHKALRSCICILRTSKLPISWNFIMYRVSATPIPKINFPTNLFVLK